MTLVDTNVLLDLATNDPQWVAWSISRLEAASLAGPLLINDIVYAELCGRFGRIEEVEAFIDEAGVEMTPIPRHALFLAAKAFAAYRRSGGSRTGVLSDFFIGAHAAADALTLLTRDPRLYQRYFPTVQLLTP